MNKICGVYKITNTATGDFYIGSSKNIKKRWAEHKCKSTWKNYPNKQLYQDMQKYGIDKFEFQILEEAEPEQLKEMEQKFIEILKPTYNQMNAKGLNIERCKETKRKCSKEYQKTEKRKETQKKYRESHKEEAKKYRESHKEEAKKYRESHKEEAKKYRNQLCSYNNETLTLNALRKRFKRQGIDHPTQEAKKYLLEK